MNRIEKRFAEAFQRLTGSAEAVSSMRLEAHVTGTFPYAFYARAVEARFAEMLTPEQQAWREFYEKEQRS